MVKEQLSIFTMKLTKNENSPFGYTLNSAATGYNYSAEYTPSWVYNSNYYYWTMSQYGDSSGVWYVYDNGNLHDVDPSNSRMVRPVLELSKSADITKIS